MGVTSFLVNILDRREPGSMLTEDKVFKSGVHKDREYTNEDLRATVEAYNNAFVTAPWTIGHEINPGDPAAGWIRELSYKESEQGQGFIIAHSQFNALGQKLLDEKTHQNKSISFYPKDSPYNPVPGVYFPRHVAMLGAEMPALTGLGTLSQLDFSDSELYSDETYIEYTFQLELTMTEFETIQNQLKALTTQVATLTNLIAEEATEEALDDAKEDTELASKPEPGSTSMAKEPGSCAACASKEPGSGSADYTVEEPRPRDQKEPGSELDYKALYLQSQLELKGQTEANASVALAQEIELLYSDGALDETDISPVDLTNCLIKLKIGAEDFSNENDPQVVINKLLKIISAKSPSVELGSVFDTGLDSDVDFAAETHVLDTASDTTMLGDDFANTVEGIAKTHELSYSQAMSAHLSAQGVVKSTSGSKAAVSYKKALADEVTRFKR
jgi:hypothetical protein